MRTGALYRRLGWSVVALLLVAGAIGVLRLEVHHSEYLSPDGRYRVVASKRWIYGLLPSMPGQGSDDPGSITIHEVASNRSLGRHEVDMVSFAYDIRWSEDRAHIPAVASWSL